MARKETFIDRVNRIMNAKSCSEQHAQQIAAQEIRDEKRKREERKHDPVHRQNSREARKIQQETGVNYTTALRQVRESKGLPT